MGVGKAVALYGLEPPTPLIVGRADHDALSRLEVSMYAIDL